MLKVEEFAQALREGVARSGLADGRSLAEAGYLSLAGSLLAYLKENLEVTVPEGAFLPAESGAPKKAVRCKVS